MTEEEKAEELAKANEAAAGGEGAEVIEPTALEKLEETNRKLIEDRDNYKAVALKRLGKLPGDAEFLGGELSVAEQVKLILLDKEIDANEKAKDEETKRLQKEVSELRLALKNRPGASLGGDGGSIVEVKDNVFTPEQLEALKRKALALKADPVKFIENAKRNFQNKR